MKLVVVAILTTLTISCREAYKSPVYPQAGANQNSDEEVTDTPDTGTDIPVLPKGPDPFEAGDHRFSLGMFYEGGFSQSLPASEAGNFLIFEGTFTLSEASAEDPVEGRRLARITYAKQLGWWGGGLLHDPAIDLSAWSKLHISLRTENPDFADLSIGMKDSKDTEVLVAVSELGFQADGTWHHLSIPLGDLTEQGLDLSQTVFSLLLIGRPTEDAVSGATLEFDNVYLD